MPNTIKSLNKINTTNTTIKYTNKIQRGYFVPVISGDTVTHTLKTFKPVAGFHKNILPAQQEQSAQIEEQTASAASGVSCKTNISGFQNSSENPLTNETMFRIMMNVSDVLTTNKQISNTQRGHKMLNINSNYTLNTNYLLQSIAELESQQTPNLISTPPVVQEATPATKIQKTTKSTKVAAKATLSTNFKSITTQHGYFIPSTRETKVVETTYNTTLSVNVITKGYTLGCEINGVQQTSVGDIYYTNWLLKGLQPNDTVKITVIGGKSDQVITYTVHQSGVNTDAPEGIKGTHSIIPDTQDKYRKEAAQQVVEVPAPAQEAPAQVEETTVEVAPASAQQEETAPAQAEEKVLDFGKHAGEAPSALSSSYLKWLVSHESRLADGNRWVCTAAKAILAARQAQEQKAA